MAPLRARLGAAFAAHLSPEHTRRATLFERLTVQRLSWDVLVCIHRYLELVGKHGGVGAHPPRGTGVFLLARSTLGFLRWRVQRELWRRDVRRITPPG